MLVVAFGEAEALADAALALRAAAAFGTVQMFGDHVADRRFAFERGRLVGARFLDDQRGAAA
jgi:hypothetical protein